MPARTRRRRRGRGPVVVGPGRDRDPQFRAARVVAGGPATDRRASQAREARPIPRSRVARLLEVERRFSQNLEAEVETNAAYRAYKATGVRKDGRRQGRKFPVWIPPEEPTGEINLTDPDSRNMLAARGFVQGYNAQAAVNEQHVVIAAEICVHNPDFGNLEPVLLAAETELANAGVTDTPEVVLADAGVLAHRADAANRGARDPGADSTRRAQTQRCQT